MLTTWEQTVPTLSAFLDILEAVGSFEQFFYIIDILQGLAPCIPLIES